MHVRTPKEPGTATILRNELATSRKAAGYVRHVEIDLTGSGLEGQFLPGQAIGVIAEGVDEAGKPHKVRLYSICSPARGEDGKGVVVATTVKRLIDEHWESHKLFVGVSSNYLCDRRPGDKVLVSGPAGKRFVLPVDKSAHDYVFFATGTGIAPFRGFIMDLLENNCTSQVFLIMGSPYSTDLLYHADLLRLQEQHKNFQYITAISREKQADGHDPLYIQDRIRTERERLLPALISPRTLIYVCGVAGMELGIFQQLALHLTGNDLRQYLDVDPEALAAIRQWTRPMIHKQVRPTRRVFLEVYA
ncbi:MAG: hypothetical protein IBJ10_02935 [Phycisphaerales bacterium]|nr:hypothetical protein [Phycisphaerales bacterium]